MQEPHSIVGGSPWRIAELCCSYCSFVPRGVLSFVWVRLARTAQECEQLKPSLAWRRHCHWQRKQNKRTPQPHGNSLMHWYINQTTGTVHYRICRTHTWCATWRNIRCHPLTIRNALQRTKHSRAKLAIAIFWAAAAATRISEFMVRYIRYVRGEAFILITIDRFDLVNWHFFLY